MSGFVEGIDRSQSTLFPAVLDDYVAEDNLVRAVDAFVEGLDLGKLGFSRVGRWNKGGPAIIRRRCSRYTFMAISIAFRRADALSVSASVISSWSG
jgi:Transposase and inactivated derivatives